MGTFVNYELVYRRFARRMIYEVSHLIGSDGKVHSLSREPFDRGVERSTDQPKDDNLFSFLLHGWPKPAQGGVEIEGRSGQIWKRIFIDDLFLCPDCGSFHYENRKPELLEFDELERDWISFKAKIEARNNVKEFYFKRCADRRLCEMFRNIGLKKFKDFNRESRKTGVPLPKPAAIPEVEIKEEEPAGSKVFVYIIEANSFFKIGVAVNVRKRLASLQTSSPFPLKLIKSWECTSAMKAEKHLHKLFKDYRHKGEWFRLPADQVANLLRISNLDEFASGERVHPPSS